MDTYFDRATEPFGWRAARRFGPITLAYETYGRLNPARDNAILLLHALTGDSHCASHWRRRPEPGWWEGWSARAGRSIPTATL